MHSSRMRTARLLTVFCSSRGGESAQSPLDADPLYPWMQTPLDADPTLGFRPLSWMQTPLGHVTCDACWEATPPRQKE